ncbi:site-2 protease family protein [Phormidium yuhuli AB48]|uniref:Zinc metalloprotease n=1 Tax=Phormidium yuhuli AB48 TaxID=2940671 RepID=A0ABY5AN94_9CYAN|nr:site-2 protease family protein [Phormidium yuhuli]USR90673.1 site-2 protease family protein [Phormidium yuhuli AB48]
MQSGARIGSLFGIPLYIHSSWFVILALFTFAKGVAWQETYNWGGAIPFVAGFVSSVLLFASVLLHELGHSLTAQTQGIKVNSITLFLFGGVAAIDRESKTPGQAFQVAIAGPAVSFALFVLLSLLVSLLSQFPTPAQVLLEELARINLVLCLFNLIPGLPLDGGQVLKAAIWQVTGDRFKAVRWAAKSGVALGTGAMALGLFGFLLLPGFSGGLWIALIGWFILQNASNYGRVTTLQELLVTTPVTEAMTREFRVVDGTMTIRDFADRYLLSEIYEGHSQTHPYFAASHGRYRGAIRPEDIRSIERSQWDHQALETIAHPIAELVTLPESATLVEAILLLERSQLRELTILTPASAVAGVLDRVGIVQSIAAKTGITIPASEMEWIKREARYPNGFPLVAIAKSVQLDS